MKLALATPVRELGLRDSDDGSIWNFAAAGEFSSWSISRDPLMSLQSIELNREVRSVIIFEFENAIDDGGQIG